MAPKPVMKPSGTTTSARSRQHDTDQVENQLRDQIKHIKELRASTAALAVGRLLKDTGGEISINLHEEELPSDEEYYRFGGVVDGIPNHAIPNVVVNVGRVPNIRSRQVSPSEHA